MIDRTPCGRVVVGNEGVELLHNPLSPAALSFYTCMSLSLKNMLTSNFTARERPQTNSVWRHSSVVHEGAVIGVAKLGRH